MTEQELIKEIRSWIKTKWMHGQSVKGRGTDCIQFIISVSKAAGWLPEKFKSRPYNVDYALHNPESILIQELEKYCERVQRKDMQPGDIITFTYGQCASHAGFYVGDGRMVHAHIRHGVIEVDLATCEKDMHSVWRVKHG